MNTDRHNEPVVGIVMGSDTDLPVMSEAARMLDKFEIPRAHMNMRAPRSRVV
jgi:phosphoribosylcarboxyaminoimidazole (NCAIR) mutase